jgi:hypothetical protein
MNHEDILAALQESKEEAWTLEEIAQKMGLNIYSYVSWIRAALKATNRGYTDIKLRGHGTKKVHIFQGERILVDKPANGPAWLPDRIWKPIVKKICIQKLVEI